MKLNQDEKRTFLSLQEKLIKLGDRMSQLEDEGKTEEAKRVDVLYRKVLAESISLWDKAEAREIFSA